METRRFFCHLPFKYVHYIDARHNIQRRVSAVFSSTQASHYSISWITTDCTTLRSNMNRMSADSNLVNDTNAATIYTYQAVYFRVQQKFERLHITFSFQKHVKPVSWCDLPFSEYFCPRLTVVFQPIKFISNCIYWIQKQYTHIRDQVALFSTF